jgi:hypothetical protein
LLSLRHRKIHQVLLLDRILTAPGLIRRLSLRHRKIHHQVLLLDRVLTAPGLIRRLSLLHRKIHHQVLLLNMVIIYIFVILLSRKTRLSKKNYFLMSFEMSNLSICIDQSPTSMMAAIFSCGV